MVEVKPAQVCHRRMRRVACQATRWFDARRSSKVVIVDHRKERAAHSGTGHMEAPVLRLKGRLHCCIIGRRRACSHLREKNRCRLLAARVHPWQHRRQERGARRPHLRARVDRHRRVHLHCVVQRSLNHWHNHQVADALKGCRHRAALPHPQRLLGLRKQEDQLAVDKRRAIQPVTALTTRLERAAELVSRRIQQHAIA